MGKFQNPWLECNVDYCQNNQIHVARRSSGGGTVYHDPGNVNISVFSHRDFYSRNQNLNNVKSTLEGIFPNTGDSDFSISDRDDLLWKNLKISGSAARLDSKRAYHHFTLLLKSDKILLKKCLKTEANPQDFVTRASRSVSSPTANLLTTDDNLDEYLHHFLESLQATLDLKDDHLLNLDQFSDLEKFPLFENFDYSAILQDAEKLQTWDWIYGKTPNFTYQGQDVKKGYFVDNNSQFVL